MLCGCAKNPVFRQTLFVLYFQNIPAHIWIVRIKNLEFTWNLSLRFIKVLQYVVDAWTYEKFQNSSEIYPYDIKVFHLIHERTKILEFWWNLSLRFMKILQLMLEHMKIFKIPVKFILTISKIFHLIHERTKIPEFWWNLSLRFMKILQLMLEHMKNSKIPVKFILTISKYSTSYMSVPKFLSSGEIYPYVLSKYYS